MDTYISDTRLAGSVPGRVTSSGKIAALGKKGTVWYEHGQLPDGRWQYGRAPGSVEVPPVPTPTPAPAFAIFASGAERFLVGDIVAGLNAFGGLGTTKAAPVGVPTYRSGGLLRVGLYLTAANLEFLLHGRAIEGFTVGAVVGGKRIVQSNQLLTGFDEIAGGFGDGAVWTGSTAAGLRIEQRPTIVGTAVRLDVTLTNTSTQTMTDVRYMRSADFDMDDDTVADRDKNAFPTDNCIVARGTVRAGLRGVGNGLFAFLRSDDPRAVASFFGFVNSDPYAPAAYDRPQAVGTTKTADVTCNLTFAVGALAPGQSAALSLSVGIAASLTV